MKQNRSSKFKCKVALEALKENRTLNEIAKDYGGTSYESWQMEKRIAAIIQISSLGIAVF